MCKGNKKYSRKNFVCTNIFKKVYLVMYTSPGYSIGYRLFNGVITKIFAYSEVANDLNKKLVKRSNTHKTREVNDRTFCAITFYGEGLQNFFADF